MVGSLKKKTLHGVAWSFIDNIANSGITFLVGLILARLLTPAEYGIMAMVAIFIAVSTSIIDSGFSNALIRKNDIKRIDYNTVFYFNLVISFLLHILLILFSPLISSFFKEPVLSSVIKVLSWILIINALGIIPRTILVINIDFKTQAKASFISSLLSGFVGIGMAFYGLGVWSLVGQQIIRQLLNTFFLWIYCRWRPVWEFSMVSFKEMFGFGSKLMISGLIDTIYKNIYYLIIGHFYNSALLGQYTRAEQFKNIFASNLTSVVQRVSYPVLSSIQNEPDRLKDGYRRIIKITMLVTFTFMIGLASVAKPLILVLIGEKWMQAVPFLQIICLGGMLYPLHAINLNILQVKGRSDLFLKLEIIKKMIALAPIVVGVFWGIEFMLWGSVATSFIAFFLNSYYSADLINYSTWNQIKDILPTLIVSCIAATAMWSLTLTAISIYLILPLQCLVGLVVVISIYEYMRFNEYLEVKQMIISLIISKR